MTSVMPQAQQTMSRPMLSATPGVSSTIAHTINTREQTCISVVMTPDDTIPKGCICGSRGFSKCKKDGGRERGTEGGEEGRGSEREREGGRDSLAYLQHCAPPAMYNTWFKHKAVGPFKSSGSPLREQLFGTQALAIVHYRRGLVLYHQYLASSGGG